MDELCKAAGQKRPRMYRKRVQRDYLRLSKTRKRSGKAIRSAVHKQLQYIRLDMGYIAELVQKGAKLSSKQTGRLNIVATVYEQQRLMFASGTHSVPQHIVSLAQAWFQPIVRGKAHANIEFGSKLHISLVDGYARIERLDFEPFNESEGLWRVVARYRERYGCYPERILADKIYRNRQTLAFCREHGHPSLRPRPGQTAKRPGPVTSIQETGVSGQLRPQCCGGCFRDGQDHLWFAPRHGTPAGDCCLCDWRCPAALEPFQIPEGRSHSVCPHVSAISFPEVEE